MAKVFITTSPYRQQDRQHAPSATLPLPHPSAETRVLVSAAVRALRSIYRPGFNYVKAGMMLVNLQSQQGQAQDALDLFETDESTTTPPRDRARLMSALDERNERFGRQAVTVASAARKAGPSAHPSRQERRSPRYTTRLEEIVTVRA